METQASTSKAVCSQGQTPKLPRRLPDEMVSHIASYLGVYDLLNCRHVCKMWNVECCKHLKKSKFVKYVVLGLKSNIGLEYALLKDDDKLKLPVPLHLKLEFLSESSSCEFKDDFQNIETLLSIYGPDGIQGITIVFESLSRSLSLDLLFQLISKFAPYIRVLDITISHRSTPAREAKDMESNLEFYKDLEFPKLERLICRKLTNWDLTATHPTVHPDMTRIQSSFYNFLIRKSPKLKILDVHYFQRQRRNATNLIEDSLISYLSMPGLNTLTTLKLVGLRDEEWVKFAQGLSLSPPAQLPKLKKLKLSLPSGDSELTEENGDDTFTKILTSFSSTLTSICLVIDSATNFDENHIMQLVRLPPLPLVKHAKIILKNYDLDVSAFEETHIDPAALNFCPEILPSLESLDFPLKGLLSSPDFDDWEAPIIFPKVGQLTLRVKEWFFEEGFEGYPSSASSSSSDDETETESEAKTEAEAKRKLEKDAMFTENVVNRSKKRLHRLQSMFPNVRDLLVVNEMKASSVFDFHHIIKEILLSERAPNVQNLGIITHNPMEEMKEALRLLNPVQPCCILRNIKLEADVLTKITQLIQQSSAISMSCKGLTTVKHDNKEMDVQDTVITFEESASAPKHKMTDLRTLTLGIPKIYSLHYDGGELDLNLMKKYFPNLTGLKISTELLGGDERNKKIKQIFTHFPESTIHLNQKAKRIMTDEDEYEYGYNCYNWV